jgi:uncharacterized phiE125 gp8 family phage protein
MALILITPPDSEPLTADQARARSRSLAGKGDPVVVALLAAARASIELEIGRSLLTQTWQVTADAFDPTWCANLANRGLLLPMPPLQSVDSVKYFDRDGDEQTLDAASYSLIPGTPARLVLAPGKSWPRTMNVPGAVRVTFTAGYSDDGDDVPENIRCAIALQAGYLASLLDKDLYVSHEQVGQLSRSFRVDGGAGTAITAAAQALLKDLKVFW